MNFAALLGLSMLSALRTFDLMTKDEITFKVRNWVDRWSAFYREAYYCTHCSLYWYGAAWLATGLLWGSSWEWRLLAGSFAVNYVGAWVKNLERSQ